MRRGAFSTRRRASDGNSTRAAGLAAPLTPIAGPQPTLPAAFFCAVPESRGEVRGAGVVPAVRAAQRKTREGTATRRLSLIDSLARLVAAASTRPSPQKSSSPRARCRCPVIRRPGELSRSGQHPVRAAARCASDGEWRSSPASSAPFQRAPRRSPPPCALRFVASWSRDQVSCLAPAPSWSRLFYPMLAARCANSNEERRISRTAPAVVPASLPPQSLTVLPPPRRRTRWPPSFPWPRTTASVASCYGGP